jgi:hypothetical protein
VDYGDYGDLSGVKVWDGYKSKKPHLRGAFSSLSKEEILKSLKALSFFLVLVLELLNTASGIDEQLLAGKEGMRSRAYFDLDYGIFLAIFHFDGFFGGVGRAANEFMVA